MALNGLCMLMCLLVLIHSFPVAQPVNSHNKCEPNNTCLHNINHYNAVHLISF